MAQSTCGAHKGPLVERRRRSNRNGTQRREQENRATARFVKRVLRMESMTHIGVTVGGALAELVARPRMAPGDAASLRPRGPSSSNESVCGRNVSKRPGRQSWTDKELTRRGSAWIRSVSTRSWEGPLNSNDSGQSGSRREGPPRRLGRDVGRQCRTVGASPYRRGGAGAARGRRGWSGVKRRGVMMEPVTGKPKRTVTSKKPQCGPIEGERHSRQSGTKPYGARQRKRH